MKQSHPPAWWPWRAEFRRWGRMSRLFCMYQLHLLSQTLTVNPQVDNESLGEPSWTWLLECQLPLSSTDFTSYRTSSLRSDCPSPFLPRGVVMLLYMLGTPLDYLWSCLLALLQLPFNIASIAFLLLMFLVVTISTVTCTMNTFITAGLSSWSSAATFEWLKSVGGNPWRLKQIPGL